MKTLSVADQLRNMTEEARERKRHEQDTAPVPTDAEINAALAHTNEALQAAALDGRSQSTVGLSHVSTQIAKAVMMALVDQGVAARIDWNTLILEASWK